MAKVERIIDAPVEDVWAALADGWNYANWVVGTPHVRDVEPDWPAPGSRLHHASGSWPLLIKDVTVVRRAEPPHLLVMEPRLWPFGRGRVTLRLTPVGQRTRVSLAESFDRGPMRWLMVRLNDLLLHRRNVEALRRLAELVTNHAAQRPRQPHPQA
jgi:uncharacterized protein YndB with AHSA1/START domain